MPAPLQRTVWVLTVEHPALVLGSTQADAVADAAACAAAGVAVVRRHSGGGAVLLRPGDLWVDVLLPRGDPLWADDVGVATHWLGDVWAAAIGPPASVHRGPMLRTAWSDVVCFAGLGPGEVTDGPGGPKLVGISQRRTRAGARMQAVALREWDAVGIVSLLHTPPEAAVALAAAARGVELSADALLAHLPD
jgi:lipoate-protein ligase A